MADVIRTFLEERCGAHTNMLRPQNLCPLFPLSCTPVQYRGLAETFVLNQNEQPVASNDNNPNPHLKVLNLHIYLSIVSFHAV